MEQLSLDSISAGLADVLPYSYRIARNGNFIVTANVDGVGRLQTRGRFLAPAISELQAKITAALAARPSTMF
jgi:hypothetical protein